MAGVDGRQQLALDVTGSVTAMMDSLERRVALHAETAGLGFLQAASMLSGKGGLFSDRRLKSDVERIGEHNGLGLYKYRYNWDAPDRRRVGVMADEVARLVPEAVGERDGYATVDYARLGLAHLVEA